MSISLVNLLFASLGLFILFKLVLLPFTTKVATSDSTPSALKKYIIRNMVDFGGTFFFMAMISSGITWIIVKIINMKGGTTLQEVVASLDFVKSIESITSDIANNWAFVTTALLAGALIILTYKSTKKSFDERLNASISKELEKLQEEVNNGKWEDLPPTEEMKKVYILIQEYSDKIEELQSSSASKDEVASLNLLIENKEKLVSYLRQLDIQRRINVEIEEEEYPEPESIKDRILLFFVSQGLMNTFKKGSSIIFILGLFLLVPSLLSIGAIAINDNIKVKAPQLEAKIEKLELEIQTREIEKDFNKLATVNKQNSDNPLSEEDEQVLNELSTVFENNIVSTRTIGRGTINFSRNSGITNQSVRTAILDQFSNADKKIKVNNPEGIPEIVNDAVILEKNAILNKEPTTNLGKRIKDDLRIIAVNNKELWKHYKNITIDATKSFQVPAFTRDIKGMMVSNVVGHVAQGLEIPGAAGKIAGNLAQIPSDLAEQFYVNESKRYMVALARAEYLDKAIQEIGEVKYKPMPSQHIEELKLFSNSIPEEGKLSEIMAEHPPSVSREFESHIQIAKAQETINNIAKVNGTLNSQTFADALSSFGDYFPGYQGEETKTAKGKVMSTTNSYSAGGSSSSKAAFTRSRSYVGLRGFSRIGGVLIGMMPNGENAIDIKEINWKKENENYIISLVKGDDKEVILGKFNPSIINLALGYTADGRVTTVTMVQSDPLYDLRILLHPILVDTGLGCRAIKLDQIADETSSDDIKLQELRQNSNLKINNAKILYSLAWALRLKKVADQNNDIADQIRDYLVYADDVISNYSDKSEKILTDNNYNLEFISSKLDFYDKELVEIIKKCQNTNNYKQCVNDSSSVTISSTDDPTWLYPPPKTTEWSGVREREYTIDEDLNFLLANKHDELWPFRFMVQTVFTSEPDFASERENYSDSNPWEFNDVNKLLMDSIKSRLSEKPELKSIISDMKEFTILQRLFRLALNEKLGKNFPLEKLATLAKETKPYLLSHHRTLRWLPKPGALEQVSALELLQEKDDNKIKEVLSLQQQLREELGINKDEQQVMKNIEKECPKP